MSVINGTPGPDVLNGTALGDQINGGGGDDVIRGFGGADTVNGGAGADRFVWNAGEGSDKVEGGADADTEFFAADGFVVSASAGHALVTNLAETVDLHGVETLNMHGVTPGASFTVGDLSATDVRQVVIGLDAGVNAVTLNGAATGDVFEVQVLSGGTLRVFDVVGGVVQTIVASKLDAADLVTVDAGAGNDVIVLEASAGVTGPAPITARGGAGNDTVTGSTGSDRLFGDAGDDRFVADFSSAGAALDTVVGGADLDTVAFTSTAGADTITLSATNGHETVALNGAASLDLTGVETLSVRPGAGADTVQVNLLNGSEVRNTTIDLSGATPGVGDGAADSVKVTGSSLSDSLVVIGTGEGSSVSVGQHTTTDTVAQITGRDAGDQVTVDAGAGDDSILVDLGVPLGPLTIDGGAGADTVKAFIENTANTITFSNHGNHVAHGAASLDLANVETFEVDLVGPEGGTNTVVVNGAGPTNYGVFVSGSIYTIFQADNVNQGPLINIDNFAGNDRIVINAGDGGDNLDWRGGIVNFNGGGGTDSALAFVQGSCRVLIGDGGPEVSAGVGDLSLTGVEKLTLTGSSTGAHFDIFDLTGAGLQQLEVDLGGSAAVDSVSLFANTARDTTVTLSASSSGIAVGGLGSSILLRPAGGALLISIQGGVGNDNIQGGNVSTKLLIDGGAGNDVIAGGLGGDDMHGGSGDDTLTAQGIAGDTLDGGSGDDLLVGGLGNDLFKWDFGHDGHDTIENFHQHDAFSAHDRIEISNTFGSSLSQLETAGFITQVGLDVVLVNSTLNSFTLKNVLLTSLNDSDFSFI